MLSFNIGSVLRYRKVRLQICILPEAKKKLEFTFPKKLRRIPRRVERTPPMFGRVPDRCG
jgi:hypothetical protein